MNNLGQREIKSTIMGRGDSFTPLNPLPYEFFGKTSPSLFFNKEETMREKSEIQEGIRELLELRDSVVEKLYDMRSIIRQLDGHDGMIIQRATSYWIPNTITNLTDDHEWLSRGSMINFKDTISDLRELIGEEETEEEEAGERR
jgi:hypothetical protein